MTQPSNLDPSEQTARRLQNNMILRSRAARLNPKEPVVTAAFARAAADELDAIVAQANVLDAKSADHLKRLAGHLRWAAE